MGGDTSPVNILSDPGAWILFVGVLSLAEYIIILRLYMLYTMCFCRMQQVACDNSRIVS